jgi:hypothetical protein
MSAYVIDVSIKNVTSSDDLNLRVDLLTEQYGIACVEYRGGKSGRIEGYKFLAKDKRTVLAFAHACRNLGLDVVVEGPSSEWEIADKIFKPLPPELRNKIIKSLRR